MRCLLLGRTESGAAVCGIYCMKHMSVQKDGKNETADFIYFPPENIIAGYCENTNENECPRLETLLKLIEPVEM